MSILLTTRFVKRPLVFSLPRLRLGLNVASTGLVLGDAYAGEVVAVFGSIVVSDSLIMGCAIFLILVAPRMPNASPGSAPAALFTQCLNSRWPSMPTSTPG